MTEKEYQQARKQLITDYKDSHIKWGTSAPLSNVDSLLTALKDLDTQYYAGKTESEASK